MYNLIQVLHTVQNDIIYHGHHVNYENNDERMLLDKIVIH